MNWLLLLPSTVNLFSIIQHLFDSDPQLASQALSDLFILGTIGLTLFFGILAAISTLSSWRESGEYLILLQKDGDPLGVATSSELPLFRELQHHLLSIPNRDGSTRITQYRTIDSAEVFSETTLAQNLTSSRLFLAVPGILTGIGVKKSAWSELV